jgi:predicted dithiol-disulfide oxidoreductase (DUF899 family)
MGWSFPWVSSFGSDFNFNYHASFASARIAQGKAYYNYEIRPIDVSDEAAISVFSKNERGEVFHTYSYYGRGIDMLNGVYQYLDLAPKPRDEDGLDFPMKWISRFVLPLTRKAGFRLAGWPLPGGRRTLWITAKGFRSHVRPPFLSS